MQVSLDEATDPWGVYIERVEVNREHYDYICEDDHYIEHSEVWNRVVESDFKKSNKSRIPKSF